MIVVAVLSGVIVIGVGSFVYFIWSGLNAVAHLEPGMVKLQLPSGTTAYIRRQRLPGKPAIVYLSESPRFCAPYDQSHDFKLPDVVQGGTESPLIISFHGDTVILHGPKQLRWPPIPPKSFNVTYDELTGEAYSAYVASSRIPDGWMRVDVPFGHNTCAL